MLHNFARQRGGCLHGPLSNRCVSISTVVQQLKVLISRDGLKISVRKQSDKMFDDFESDVYIVMSDDFAFSLGISMNADTN